MTKTRPELGVPGIKAQHDLVQAKKTDFEAAQRAAQPTATKKHEKERRKKQEELRLAEKMKKKQENVKRQELQHAAKQKKKQANLQLESFQQAEKQRIKEERLMLERLRQQEWQLRLQAELREKSQRAAQSKADKAKHKEDLKKAREEQEQEQKKQREQKEQEQFGREQGPLRLEALVEAGRWWAQPETEEAIQESYKEAGESVPEERTSCARQTEPEGSNPEIAKPKSVHSPVATSINGFEGSKNQDMQGIQAVELAKPTTCHKSTATTTNDIQRPTQRKILRTLRRLMRQVLCISDIATSEEDRHPPEPIIRRAPKPERTESRTALLPVPKSLGLPSLTPTQSPCSSHEMVTWVQDQFLCYHFRNPSLIQEALLHHEVAGALPDGNMRLALVGDGALATVLREAWYTSGAVRGQYTQKSQRLTNKHLGVVCRLSGLYEHMIRDENVILRVGMKPAADLLEAVVGAMWIDSGYDHKRLRDLLQRLGLIDS